MLFAVCACVFLFVWCMGIIVLLCVSVLCLESMGKSVCV